MAKEKFSEYIIPVGILALAYGVLSKVGLMPSFGSIQGAQGSAQGAQGMPQGCPRGEYYTTEIWRDCEDGYSGERTSIIPFSPQKCVCLKMPGLEPPIGMPIGSPAGQDLGPSITEQPGALSQLVAYFSGGPRPSIQAGTDGFTPGFGGGGGGARTGVGDNRLSPTSNDGSFVPVGSTGSPFTSPYGLGGGLNPLS